MAVLVMVALIVTALPVVAFADGDGETPEDAVVDASRIYVDKDEADADNVDKVTVTVYLRDENGNIAKLASGENLYIWAERSKDRVSQIDNPAELSSGGEVLNNKVVKFTGNATGKVKDEAEVKYTSNFDGEVKFYFYISENDDDVPKEKAPRHATTVFEYVDGYKIKLDSPSTRDDQDADGTSAYTVKLVVLDDHDFPVPGEKVNFSTSSRHLVLNKESAVSDSKGIVKVDATSERAGTYRLYAKLDSDRKVELKDDNDDKGVEFEFGAAAAYDIKVKKGDGAVIALDEGYTFEFEVFDIFGRVIKKKELNSISEVKVTTAPDGADFKDNIKKDDETRNNNGNRITWVKNLKIEAKQDDLNKEGDYVLRVKLNNGKYATAKFEVKEQGDIAEMTLEYDKKVDDQDNVTYEPTIKLIDVDGVEAELEKDNKDLKFSIDNTKIATIDDDGIVKARDDKEGVVVVTVVHTEEKMVATAEVRIGDVGAEGIKFEVPEELLIDEEYTVKMKVLDEDGYEVMKSAEYEVVVLSKPADAKVEVDVDGKEFTIYSDTKGAVKLIAVAREEGDDKAVSSTLTLDFVDESKPVVVGAEKVTLFIGNDFANVDGAMEDLDAPAFIEDGRTYVPFRFLGEAFGAEVDWDPKDGLVETVTLLRDDVEVVIGIGDEFATVTADGEVEVVSFEGLGAAKIVGGRTYLPFRAVADIFGAEVDYGTDEDGFVTWVSFEQ